ARRAQPRDSRRDRHRGCGLRHAPFVGCRRRSERVSMAAAGPNSSGTAPPRLPRPAGPLGSPTPVVAAPFSPAGRAPRLPQATAADYALLQNRIGTTRVVIVQPKAYGTDNTCTLDAIARLGDGARGIAVVHPTVTDAELRRLDAGGVRGLRFSVWNPRDT